MWQRGLTARQVLRVMNEAEKRYPNLKSMSRTEYNEILATIRAELFDNGAK